MAKWCPKHCEFAHQNIDQDVLVSFSLIQKLNMDKIVQEVGENFEYVRTIISHQIELQKLDVIEDISNVVGKSLLLMVLFFIGGIILTALSGLYIITMTSVFESATWAITSYIAILFILALILIYFRRSLVIKPITNLLFSSIKNYI